MENASKALLIAGGMLIALLVIGALLLMFNQIGDYEKAQTTSKKNSQVTDFNKDFERYTYDNIKGYDLITLINKVKDYNQKEGVSNSVDYSKKITIKVSNMKAFVTKVGVEGNVNLFKSNIDSYTPSTQTDTMNKAIEKYSELESKYTLSTMSILSANYDNIAYSDREKEDNKDKKTIKELTGKNIDITKAEIACYREYSELKNSTFESVETKYDGDQIIAINFKYVK